MSLSILAVCSGNICRSPTAAAAIAAAAAAAGIEIEVDSAGTGAWNLGEPPHPQAVATADAVGLELMGKARKIHRGDFERFDVILAMDRSNLADLLALAPSKEARAKVRLFATYHPGHLTEISDPWGGPEEGYTRMVETVRVAAEELIDSLLAVGSESVDTGE
ncbi:MAG: low molecular weight protein-tyrosine-phosphatase [Acidimicrobiia bacterium]